MFLSRKAQPVKNVSARITGVGVSDGAGVVGSGACVVDEQAEKIRTSRDVKMKRMYIAVNINPSGDF
jgi:hypothetical protein